jgi:hypothetical protein
MVSVLAAVVAVLSSLVAVHAPDTTTRRPVEPAPAVVPSGSHRVACPSASLVLPDGFRAGPGCSWSTARGQEVRVQVGVDATLARYRVREVDPFVGYVGDDGIELTVGYDAHAPTYGGRPGERLTYQPYDDGDPDDVVVVEASGVRLTWTTPRDVTPTGLDTALGTLATPEPLWPPRCTS